MQHHCEIELLHDLLPKFRQALQTIPPVCRPENMKIDTHVRAHLEGP